MAPWNEKRLGRLEDTIITTMEQKSPVIDVPYYVYLYDPAEELRALEELQNLERRLKVRGYSAEIIWMSELMVTALKRFNLLGPDILHVERQERATVKEDLQRILTNEIASQLKDKLKDEGVDHCAILLRSGALYPFVRVSSLLYSLEGYVDCTLVVGYPGNREGRMLNEKGETVKNYYRAKII